MNLTHGASPKPGFAVTLHDDSYEGADDEWVIQFFVEVDGPGGEAMDGEPFTGVAGPIRSHDRARQIANTAYRLIRSGSSADEAMLAATR